MMFLLCTCILKCILILIKPKILGGGAERNKSHYLFSEWVKVIKERKIWRVRV